MLRSTFAGFTTAHLAMSASQRSLDVTGQNIANINTKGYTRQRLDLASISPTGHSYSQMQTDCRVGQGVQMTGIVQVRDPFIDIQYRTHLAKVGTIDAQDSTLSEIGEIFDEVDSTAIRAALNDVVSQLNNMAKPDNANQGSSDTLVRSSMEVLMNIIRENATGLSRVESDLVTKLQSTDIPNINEYLQSIQQLNSSIKNTQILGGAALELQDQRNALIDELATYLPIDVYYDDLNLGAGIKVSTLRIEFNYTDENGAKKTLTLVDDENIGAFKFEPEAPKKEAPVDIFITGAKNGETETKVTEFLGNGVLKGAADMLNKSGIFDDPATDVKGIGYYEKMFDTFVNTFAKTLNQLNIDAGGEALFTPTDVDPYDQADDPSKYVFTASNIKISEKWLNGDTHIFTTIPPDQANPGDPANPANPDEVSTAYDNVLKMINAISKDSLDFTYTTTDPATGDPVDILAFKGNCFDAYDSIQNTQAIEKKATSSILNNRFSVLNEIANSKDSVSGVYMDEEVMNLMRYQQSYNAAARLMTTLDQALDTLINNTGVVGR